MTIISCTNDQRGRKVKKRRRVYRYIRQPDACSVGWYDSPSAKLFDTGWRYNVAWASASSLTTITRQVQGGTPRWWPQKNRRTYAIALKEKKCPHAGIKRDHTSIRASKYAYLKRDVIPKFTTPKEKECPCDNPYSYHDPKRERIPIRQPQKKRNPCTPSKWKEYVYNLKRKGKPIQPQKETEYMYNLKLKGIPLQPQRKRNAHLRTSADKELPIRQP